MNLLAADKGRLLSMRLVISNASTLVVLSTKRKEKNSARLGQPLESLTVSPEYRSSRCLSGNITERPER